MYLMKNILALSKQLVKHDLFHEFILNHEYLLELPQDLEAMEIQHLSYNSNDPELSEQTLFLVKGKNFKKEYLQATIDRGVKFYISEKDFEIPDTVAIIVSDIEKAMATIAQYFYDFPEKELMLVGVTGTKGKTTTTYFLRDILSQEEKPAGLINSKEVFTDVLTREATLTTPESLDTYRYLREMADNDLKYCVLEVSSQAYKKYRVHLLHFDIALFLNFSPDHVGTGEHDSMNEYFHCKRQLLWNADSIILNKQLPDFDFITDEIKLKNPEIKGIHTFSTDLNDEVDYSITSNTIDTFTLTKNESNLKKNVSLSMYGHYNHENAAGSLIVGDLFGEDFDEMIAKIRETRVSGRFEVFRKEDKVVVVDSAHNETSFREVIQSGRQHYGMERPFSVLGAASGNKAENRRAGMARVFNEQKPNKIYIAADSPNFSRIEDIAADIISETEKLDPTLEFDITYQEDREKQVEKALNDMADNEILFVLGKGTDKTQRMFGKLEPYIGDDVIVENWLKQ